jgi:hypothetical protein
MRDNVKSFKYEKGWNIINKWNWNCYIVDRYVNQRGVNCYLVESNEDPEDDEVGGVEKGKRWVLKEYEIKHRD